MAETAREHLALALDVDDLDVAVGLARRLEPWFSVAKVGLELFGAVGPRAVDELAGLGFPVFLDLKLHDIPTTVGRARVSSRSASSPRSRRDAVAWCAPPKTSARPSASLRNCSPWSPVSDRRGRRATIRPAPPRPTPR